MEDLSASPRFPNRDRSEAEILEILAQQDRRRVSSFEAEKLEREAKRNWDIFYKNNSTNFFKDRHWTLREFEEILSLSLSSSRPQDGDEDFCTPTETNGSGVGNNGAGIDKTESEGVPAPVLLEVGCGVGNFVFPILKEVPRLSVYACDFSTRAVDFVK
jgi:methyltransferase-like protein 6